MSSLPARMKKIQTKMNVLECPQHFSHCKSGDFSRRSRAANSAVHDPGSISNLFKTLWLSSLPAGMKKIGTSDHKIFPITIWELSVAMETRVPDSIWPKT